MGLGSRSLSSFTYALLLPLMVSGCDLRHTNPYDPDADVSLTVEAPFTVFSRHFVDIAVNFSPPAAVAPRLEIQRASGSWIHSPQPISIEPGRALFRVGLVDGPDRITARASFGGHSAAREISVVTAVDSITATLCGELPVRVGERRMINVTMYDRETRYHSATNCEFDPNVLVWVLDASGTPVMGYDHPGGFLALRPGRIIVDVVVSPYVVSLPIEIVD